MDNRELDALVAEKVVGRKSEDLPFVGGGNVHVMYLEHPRYSEDISAAWEVVEKITSEKRRLEIIPFRDKCDVVVTWFYPPTGEAGTEFIVSEKTAPKAICIAALKSVGVDVK